MLNTTGTKKRVAPVANTRPPITARPRGAFCSPPSPSASAMGSMPMIMARAVISTGRKREAGPPRLHRGDHRVTVFVKPLAGEGHHQDRVGGGHPHAHDGAGEGRHG